MTEMQLLDRARRRSGLSWRSPGGPIYQVPLLCIFLVALFAPTDVLDRSPLAASVAATARSTLLGLFGFGDLARFAASTDFPQVALLVSALHWSWLPISACTAAVIFEYQRRTEGYVVWRLIRGDDGRIKARDLGAVVLGLIMFLGAAGMLTMAPGDWSLTPGLTSESRLGLAVMSWAAFWLLGVSLGLVYPMARTFVDINVRGR